MGNKKIAIIIAFRNFRDEEYFIPKQVFESAGIIVDTASDSLGTAIGNLGGEAEVNVLLDKLDVSNYDAVLFIGGPGASKYIDNNVCHQITKAAVEQNKVLGAICVAPAILARAGVLKGKKATVWSSNIDKSAVKMLKSGGADYIGQPVIADGKIITADGPSAAEEFAKAVILKLKT